MKQLMLLGLDLLAMIKQAFESLDTFFKSEESVVVSVQPAAVAGKCKPLLVIVLTSAYEADKTQRMLLWHVKV